MLGMIQEVLSSFLLGLATPLTAACVLPLYPGFISYLARQLDVEDSKKTYALFGALTVTGVLSFMLFLGLVFTAFLQQSLTAVIEIVSPFAFGLLGAMSILMILDIDFSSRYSVSAPEFENPLANAFSFGFFFGAIIIPCNPAFISVFFARALLFTDPVSSLVNFTSFGLGIGFPLLAFSVISSRWSEKILNFLKHNKTRINQASGLFMLLVSIYYLVFVFNLIGIQ